MKPNQIEEGRFSEGSAALGTVTEEMIERRAREIAVISGRDAGNVLTSDTEQARRELQGEERQNPARTEEERLPESKRWDPVPGTAGRKRQTVPAPDEQTYTEKLVEEGAADAEHEKEIKASRASLRRDTQP